MLRRAVIVFIVLSSLPPFAWGQLGEEEDFPPGLLAEYAANGKIVKRIDPTVAFDWGETAADDRLPVGPFSANWQGRLLVRKAGTFQMHAYVLGEVDVALDGKTVLSGRQNSPGWISGKPFELRFGDKPLAVQFRKTAQAAQVRLFWSSDSFPLEPLPPLLLFRDGGHRELKEQEIGRTLFAASRCNRCHQRESDELAPIAPALMHLKTGTDRDWLIQKIQKPHAQPGAMMPDFGFSREQAEQIAAYLQEAGESAKLSSVKTKDRAADARRGQIAFRSVGCLACHTWKDEGQAGPFGGGDLSDIGRKRSEAWLFAWLKSPEKLNPDHRMPLVKLSDAERRQLAIFLSGQGDKKTDGKSSVNLSRNLAEAGKKLIESARCAACHRIPQVKTAVANLPDLSKPVADWKTSCLSETPDSDKYRPAYRQCKPEECKAIMRYVKSRQGSLSPTSEFYRGQMVLEQKNCLMCHERNHGKGIVETAGQSARLDEALQGQSEALIPPALNAVGDKLLDAALAEAVSGEQPRPRLPWLKVRMPRFGHAKEDKAALVRYLIGRDRIPDNAPATDKPKLDQAKADALVTGYTLVGAKGFSCVACHRVGSFEPRNVALGTRGSDLLMLGKRMRRSFYLRWTASPQRIVPGMEMPSIRKAVPGILNEDIATQLAATWEALNDPRFTAPTAPSAVEQLLVVKPGERARIVRDVFTNPKDNGGGYIARAMAIGLNNGHNILFDLDNFTLRNWTFGDFARQRTEGKSWYWDLAGVPVMKGFTEESDFVLRLKNQPDGKPIRPIKDNNAHGRLLAYKTYPNGAVQLDYRLYFKQKSPRHYYLVVRELIEPLANGWVRRLDFRYVPEDYDVWIATNRRTGIVGNPKVSVVGDDPNSKAEFVKAAEDKGVLVYSAHLKRADLELSPRPELPAEVEDITSVPGYTGKRLALPGSIMPTALTWTDKKRPGIPQGTLVFTSLKGHVYLANDTDGDGLEDSLTVFEEGLAAPYGVLPYDRGLLVAHKPELVYLEDLDGDGHADVRKVVATGWGYSENYHDWTTGLVRDSQGKFYFGLGSDYAQPKRPKETSEWRGSVVLTQGMPLIMPPELRPKNEFGDEDVLPWSMVPVGHAFRYPTGLAINEDDEIFVTDNQGVQNTFNEINHLVPGRHYGVPSRFGPKPKPGTNPNTLPAIQVPHPWTRSVNGVFFLPRSGPGHAAFRGHGIGCEYDTRFLIRFSLQKVAGEYQGAAYLFSQPNAGVGGSNFQGPLCGAALPNGDIYIGSIHDSGWLGGQNTGDIVRLTPMKTFPTNGIREVRATPEGFDVAFLKPVDSQAAANPENYDISGYTRIWKGGYATPDSNRHKLQVQSATLHNDGRTVSLKLEGRREGYVYEISCPRLAPSKEAPLFPDAAHYTLHKIPKPETASR